MLTDDIRQAIRDSGISGKRLAEETGLPQPTICRFLNGADAKGSTLDVLCDYLGYTGKHTPSRATNRASGPDAGQGWKVALSRAARKKYVTAESMADTLPKCAVRDAQMGLAILEQAGNYIVERAGNNGNYRVRKAFSIPVEESTDAEDLLPVIKDRAKRFQEQLCDSSNVHWRWDLSLEFADDLLKTLKNVKAPAKG